MCLEESLYIHNIRDMRVLHTIRDTPPNLTGLCTLSPNSDNCYVAYPGSNTIGEVQIFDANHLVCTLSIFEQINNNFGNFYFNNFMFFNYIASQNDDTCT